MQLREDLIIFAQEAFGLSRSIFVELFPLEGRGSDRTFFRARWNREDSAILVQYDPKRVENTYYADIATFLHEIFVPVPRMIRHDPAKGLIAMEDLGDTDLWSFRETHWETRRGLYQRTLTIAHRLHSFPIDEFPSARVRLMEGFGPHLYLWERNYFRDHFVQDFNKIKLGPSFERELEAELSALAERLAGTTHCLVHRDLQSRNVMIRDGEPFFIDFQGMRFGSPFYDLGSLLCDPYVYFSVQEQEELLSFYYELSNWDNNWVAFRSAFWEASAQRLMQALGAYGFLGLKKELKGFLGHIPAGLRHLQLAASQAGTLPLLRELSVECQQVVEKRGLDK
jgi:aminoglycoside/choline kinase family phosphotransferase